MAEPIASIVVDGIQHLSVHNGLGRVVLMRLGPDGKPIPVLELCIPVNQAMVIAQAIGKIK
jgi:hypothetical protein